MEVEEIIAEPTEIVAEPEAEAVVDAPTDEAVEPATDEVAEEEAEEVAEEAAEEAVEEATEEVAPPVEFDATADLPSILTQATEVLEKYELPADVQAVIDVLRTKAETPQDSFVEYAEYGDESEIKALLDDHSLIYTATTDETGNIRPNTDKFAQKLYEVAPDKASWMYYDLAQLPSQKYQGLNQFEEGIADALSIEGDTVGDVIQRYQQTVAAVKSGASIASDVPSFIPANVRDAYWSLSKEERDEIDYYDPATDRVEVDDYGKPVNIDEPVRNRKLETLAKIQKGIDGDKVLQQQAVQSQQQAQQAFNNEVVSIQTAYYDAFRTHFVEDLMSTVQFSADPKMQTILAHQNIALLTQAFFPDSDGDFARAALKDAGIEFDATKAQKLVQDIESASVALTSAKRAVDSSGKMLNPIEFNKATKAFERAGKEWQAFAKNIIDQEASLTSTGKANEVKEAVAKQKVAIKARPVNHSAPSKATKLDAVPAYGTREYHEYWAEKQLENEAKRAAAYA